MCMCTVDIICAYCPFPRKILCFNQEDRLETEGTPVPVSLYPYRIVCYLCVYIPVDNILGYSIIITVS